MHKTDGLHYMHGCIEIGSFSNRGINIYTKTNVKCLEINVFP